MIMLERCQGIVIHIKLDASQSSRPWKKGSEQTTLEMLHRRWMEPKIECDEGRENSLKENSQSEAHSCTILPSCADKRSHCTPLMFHRMKKPPTGCDSEKFEKAYKKKFRIKVPEGERNNIFSTQMVPNDCTIHMSNVIKNAGQCSITKHTKKIKRSS